MIIRQTCLLLVIPEITERQMSSLRFKNHFRRLKRNSVSNIMITPGVPAVGHRSPEEGLSPHRPRKRPVLSSSAPDSRGWCSRPRPRPRPREVRLVHGKQETPTLLPACGSQWGPCKLGCGVYRSWACECGHHRGLLEVQAPGPPNPIAN